MKKESKKWFFSISKIKNIFYEEEYIELENDEQESISIEKYINNNKNENNFQKLLFYHIDKRNLTDSEVYNKVHIDRRLFSKIRTDINYHPSKETVILLCLALELSEYEAEELLESASYSLPKNNYFDLIIRFCLIEKVYKIIEVNELLESYKCKQLNY